MPTEPEIIDPLDDATEVIPFNYSITSYGADYPVDSLVKRIGAGDILVPTFEHQEQLEEELDPFQRDYVWPRSKADRFLESLLLGLPVPGIFLVKEDSGRLLVLDGHQRLYTLKAFYDGIIHGREYRLSGIQQRFAGRSYKELDIEDRRRLDDSIIHATVVRQEEPTEDWSSIYVIFERLNTGGISLQSQEIRMALYHGGFATLLRDLNRYGSWRSMMGAPSPRLKDVELILRFFAFVYYHHSYESPMKDFLNRYMALNRELGKQSKEELQALFAQTCDLLFQALGEVALRPERAVNAAFADAIMTGVGTAIRSGSPPNADTIIAARAKLLAEEDFLAAITTGTSQKPKVDKRIGQAISAFSH
jgi:hypothetical protein